MPDLPIQEGQILTGSLFSEPMRVETARANSPASWVIGLVGTQSERFRKVTLTADELKPLTIVDGQHSFDGDGRLLRLGLQAYALDESLAAAREATTLDRVHAAMLLQAGGRANALRALLEAEQERDPDFLRLANAVSALSPKGSEEKRWIDVILLAIPR
jgi:hypothetical protein